MTQTIWSKTVRDRDGECFVCGTKEHLNAHHILPAKTWPECKLEPLNGISLCARHHTLGRESIHRGCGSILVLLKLQSQRPEQYAWILQQVGSKCNYLNTEELKHELQKDSNQ